MELTVGVRRSVVEVVGCIVVVAVVVSDVEGDNDDVTLPVAVSSPVFDLLLVCVGSLESDGVMVCVVVKLRVSVGRHVRVGVGRTVRVRVCVSVGTNVRVGVASHVALALCHVSESVSGGVGVGGGVTVMEMVGVIM